MKSLASRERCSFFPKKFTVRGSQCFKEWSPWCWMVWSGSRPSCLPLPFICLPVLFICLPGWLLVVGFPTSFHLSPSSFHLSPTLGACGRVPAGFSPTSFHFSPTSFHLSPSSFHLSPRLGACGRVPGWLVSHFLSFVSKFFSLVSQATSFHLSPTSFHLSPTCFHCLPGWVLVVGFPAGLSPTSFHLSPTSFHLSLRLGTIFICLSGWVNPTTGRKEVETNERKWETSRPGTQPQGTRPQASRPACLPLPFSCLPVSVQVVGFPAGFP